MKTLLTVLILMLLTGCGEGVSKTGGDNGSSTDMGADVDAGDDGPGCTKANERNIVRSAPSSPACHVCQWHEVSTGMGFRSCEPGYWAETMSDGVNPDWMSVCEDDPSEECADIECAALEVDRSCPAE